MVLSSRVVRCGSADSCGAGRPAVGMCDFGDCTDVSVYKCEFCGNKEFCEKHFHVFHDVLVGTVPIAVFCSFLLFLVAQGRWRGVPVLGLA